MKNFESVKQATLAHYDRMIAWAEKQPKTETPSVYFMESEIGEFWFGVDCPMCQANSQDCKKCPIGLTTGRIYCGGTPWPEMSLSETWSEWLIAAKAEQEFLANLKNKRVSK